MTVIKDEYIEVSNDNPLWQSIYQVAREDHSHPLWKNYQNIDLDTYERMFVNVRDNIPVAFHGMYNFRRFPENVSRICNRAYIHPINRNLGQGLNITGDNIKYVLDNYSKWNKDVLFISRGVQYNDPIISYKKFIKFVKFVENYTGYKLEYDDRLYSCCPSECKDCYQFCVWYDPKHIRHTLDMPSIYLDDWHLLP